MSALRSFAVYAAQDDTYSRSAHIATLNTNHFAEAPLQSRVFQQSNELPVIDLGHYLGFSAVGPAGTGVFAMEGPSLLS
jgi:hypothetical protein